MGVGGGRRVFTLQGAGGSREWQGAGDGSVGAAVAAGVAFAIAVKH